MLKGERGRLRIMKLIENQNFPNERDLYGAEDAVIRNCRFDGIEDGESALKEAKRIRLENCFMNLRYPLWHVDTAALDGVTMTDKCRAALWYSNDIEISNSNLLGIKALRECSGANIVDSKIVSPEFGWKCNGVSIKGSDIESEYLFLMSKNIELDRVNFKGKYSFQYVENMRISDSMLDTKDAFWHTKNVIVERSTVKGEYLGWYSENLTLIDCTIIGAQPLCYCKNLKLIGCKMQETDLSFEYSDVEATVRGEIMSVKNPRAGKIVADAIGEIIITADSKYPCDCDIIEKSRISG